MSEPIGDYVRGELLEQAVNRASELEAELADLRASSVVYKVRCESCDDDGMVVDRSSPDVVPPKVPCDCDNGWRLAEGVERIERYRSHHVLILADSFTTEHPITCDLTACDVYTRCSNEWEGPPAPPGWYLIDVDTLELSEAEDREIAFVIPARLIEGDT